MPAPGFVGWEKGSSSVPREIVDFPLDPASGGVGIGRHPRSAGLPGRPGAPSGRLGGQFRRAEATSNLTDINQQ